MSKPKLFNDDSDEEEPIKTKNEFAKKYDSWREKEERHKLEQKYGDKILNSDASISSDSEDSDESLEVTEETETQFLKTLALLKTKDPRIYDPNYKFFDGGNEKEPDKVKTNTLTFADSDDEDDEGGDIFTIEKKAPVLDTANESTKIDENDINSKKNAKSTNKEEKLKDYLTGKAEHIDDEVEKDLAPLKALWSDPKLNEGEVFLRDYILDKRYLDEGEAGEAEDKIRDDDDLEADEQMVEEQGKFERAYNFRFEEPDDEYLKRFPRTMNYIRPKDDRRSRKRAEVRSRKEEEKKKKMEEIARLKALKLKEIQEKIAKIKEVTGNEDLAFKEEDIEGEFDPAEHDKRMQAIFDEQYYGEADDKKPVFPDLDEELEIENWEKYEPGCDGEDIQNQSGHNFHCEDDDFNMDADYDPKQARVNLLEEIKHNLGKKRRNRKKKSKLAALLATEKPKFLPTVAEKSYSDFMEEYYKMDCEDVIGGELPTRFKYREVVPNDFGLTVEEILLADDKELTQWVPLKKLVKYRPGNVEKSEVNTYAQKAADVKLKRKILPSLFKNLPEEPELVVPVEEATKKKKKKKKKRHEDADFSEIVEETELNTSREAENTQNAIRDGLKKKKKIHKDINMSEIQEKCGANTSQVIENISNTTDDNPKKKKKNKVTEIEKNEIELGNVEQNGDYTNEIQHEVQEEIEVRTNNETGVIKRKKKRKKHTFDGFVVENITNEETALHKSSEEKDDSKNISKESMKRKSEDVDVTGVPNKRKKKNKNKVVTIAKDLKQNKAKFKVKQKSYKNKNKTPDNPLNNLSDERLKAFGLNPKKYRSFLKYKKF